MITAIYQYLHSEYGHKLPISPVTVDTCHLRRNRNFPVQLKHKDISVLSLKEIHLRNMKRMRWPCCLQALESLLFQGIAMVRLLLSVEST